MDSANWHAAPPLLNLLALWEKGGPLEKEEKDPFASLCKLLVGHVDWLGEPALEVTPYF